MAGGRGEALGLSWSDVDLDGWVLHVLHALQRVGGLFQVVEPRSLKAWRSIPLPPMTVACLREHRAAQGRERLAAGGNWVGDEWDLVITTAVGTPLDASNATHRFQRILEDAGPPRQRFHDLRHSCASFLIAQGIDVRQFANVLGHAQVTLTLSTYAHVLPGKYRAMADATEKLLSGE